MQRVPLLALVAFLGGCASVLGLDSGNPLDTVSGEAGVDHVGLDGGASDGGGSVDGSDGAVSCASTQKSCDGTCVDTTDPRYGCGPTACHACSGSNVHSFTCSTDACQIAECARGYGDCDGHPSTGCETDLSTPANCGACGHACSGATSLCSQGTCVATCPPGLTNCNGACVDLSSSPQHCGRCDVSCPSQNAQALCTSNQCALTCNRGYLDCDRINSTGCEQAEDVSHCGASCVDCTSGFSASHLTGYCDPSGSCAPSGCQPGWYDCNGPGDGCESPSPCSGPDSGTKIDSGGTCYPVGASCFTPSDCCAPATCGSSLTMTPLPDPPVPIDGVCCMPSGVYFPSCSMGTNPCCGGLVCVTGDGGWATCK